MEKPYLIQFSKIGEEAIGHLSVAENQKEIPFDIKRVYWVYGTPSDVERGNHAHKEGRQLLIAVSGSIEIVLIGENREELVFLLNDPSVGLYVPKMYWRKLHFEHQAVCLCLANTCYDPDDYIFDFDRFNL